MSFNFNRVGKLLRTLQNSLPSTPGIPVPLNGRSSGDFHPRRLVAKLEETYDYHKNSVWVSDPSTYPIMALLTCAIVGPLSFVAYYMSTSPDCRVRKRDRKNPWRGHLREEIEEETNWNSNHGIGAPHNI